MSQGERHDPESDRDIATLYGEVDRSEPSTDLDNTILAAARREVGAGPRRRTSPFTQHRFIPASAAAVVLLSVTVVMLMRNYVPEEFSAPRPASLSAPTADRAAPPAPPVVAAKKAQSKEEMAIQEEKSRPVTPELKKDAATLAVPSADSFGNIEANEAPAPRSIAPVPSLRATPQPPSTGVAETQAKQMQQMRMEQLRRQAEAQMRMEAERQQMLEFKRRALMDQANQREDQSKSKQAEPLAPAERVAEPATYEQDPDKWLQHIAELQKQGDKAGVERELERFKQNFPKYPDEEIHKRLPPR